MCSHQQSKLHALNTLPLCSSVWSLRTYQTVRSHYPTLWQYNREVWSNLCAGYITTWLVSNCLHRDLLTPRKTNSLWSIKFLSSPQHRNQLLKYITFTVESSWYVMAHGDARETKWRGNWRMEWVASTLHTTSEHVVSSITTADAKISAASSRLNWRPRRFKWTRPFRRKTKSGFCACAITYQTQSTILYQARIW
jgi:hypothetical protein